MRILIDADACPVVWIVEHVAKAYGIELILFCDTSHQIHSDYGQVVTVSKGNDAVDFALITHCRQGDLIVTQDYGVAAMALGKGAYALHQSGRRYTKENIDQMLFERHLAKESRRSGGRFRGKGPKKRTAEDDYRFETALRQMIELE